MPEHIKYEDDDLFNPETHHEHSDVPVRPLFIFIAVFIALGIVSHIALFLLYKGFVAAERKRMDPPQTQVQRPADASVPQNQPLLQPFPRGNVAPQRQTPVSDMADMRRAEDQVLKNYGWIDKQHGVVHIPISDAKKMYAARVAVEGALAAPVVPTPAVPPAQTPAGNSVTPDSGVIPAPAAAASGQSSAPPPPGGAQ
jgi:hypothetical protein